MRADLAVFQKGWADSRNKAQALLLSGVVLEGDSVVTKAGALVNPDKLRLREEPKQFVSRGGIKLDGFLKAHPELKVEGVKAVDIGASTGGFTHCLLKRGAHHVTCIDVGTNQLDWKIRTDSRVTWFEKTDIRSFPPPENIDSFGMVVVDVSFISLTKILPALRHWCGALTSCILLIKPQFEVGRDRISRGGIVKDREAHADAVHAVVSFATELGFALKSIMPSALLGTDGNQEYFAWFAGSPLSL